MALVPAVTHEVDVDAHGGGVTKRFWVSERGQAERE